MPSSLALATTTGSLTSSSPPPSLAVATPDSITSAQGGAGFGNNNANEIEIESAECTEGQDVLSPLPALGASSLSRAASAAIARSGGSALKKGKGKNKMKHAGHKNHSNNGRGRRTSQMRVVARIRPLSEQEVGRGCTEAVVPIILDDNDGNSCRDGNGNDDAGMDMGADENAPPSVFHTPKIGNRRTTAMMASDGDSSPMAQPQPQPASTSLLAGGNVNTTTTTNTNSSVSSAAAAMPKQFDFDAVFSSTTPQRDVYDQSVGDAIRRNVFRGYNTTIIAYGQTSSGKTYTMNGPAPPTQEAEQSIVEDVAMTSPTARPFVSPRARGMGQSRRQSSLARMAASNSSSAAALTLTESDGIIPRAIHDLFETQRTEQREARIHLSYLEIYNDQIRDLLGSGSNDEGGAEGGTATAENLPLLDDGQGVSVRGLSSTEVRTAGEARELMDRASLRRTTGVSLVCGMGVMSIRRG